MALTKAEQEELELLELEAEEAQTKKEPVKDESPVQAGLEGFGEGVSLGYLGNIQAATEKPAFALLNAITGQDVKADDYVQARDYYNKRQENLKQENPASFYGGQIAGSIAGGAPLLKAGQAATAGGRILKSTGIGAGIGAAQSTDDKAGEIDAFSLAQLTERAKNAIIGGGLGLAGGAVAESVPLISKQIGKAGASLGTQAEKQAIKATGATGAQSQTFKEGSGRVLLDEGYVGFGDAPEDIAKKLQTAMQKSNQHIDEALKKLDESGAKASVENIVSELEKKIEKLNETAGNRKLINQIRGEIDDLYERGQSNMPLSMAEESKRNFQGQVNYNSDLADQKAAFTLADAFKTEVEQKALMQNPELAKQFTEAKKTYGLLAPVKEAAERRAATTNQSPFGGLLDSVTAGGTGGVVGGPVGLASGVAAAGARRIVSPRLASSLAVSADKLSKVLQSVPEFAELYKTNPAAVAAISQNLSKILPKESYMDETEIVAENMLQNPKMQEMSQTNPQAFSNMVQSVADKKKKEKQTGELLQQAQQLNVSPYDTEQTILKSQDLTPSQKAKAIKMNSRR